MITAFSLHRQAPWPEPRSYTVVGGGLGDVAFSATKTIPWSDRRGAVEDCDGRVCSLRFFHDVTALSPSCGMTRSRRRLGDAVPHLFSCLWRPRSRSARSRYAGVCQGRCDCLMARDPELGLQILESKADGRGLRAGCKACPAAIRASVAVVLSSFMVSSLGVIFWSIRCANRAHRSSWAVSLLSCEAFHDGLSCRCSVISVMRSPRARPHVRTLPTVWRRGSRQGCADCRSPTAAPWPAPRSPR